MNSGSRYFCCFLILGLLISGITLTGCATGTAGDGTGATFGQIFGQAMGEVLQGAVTEGSDRAMGKHKGKISSIRVLREDDNGYLIEVRYRSVKYPQGVSIGVDAYGAAGLLTEYTSTPYAVTTSSGRAQVQLYYQGGGWTQTKPLPDRITAKLFRDGNPDNYFAASTLDLSSKTTTPMAAAPAAQAAEPDVIVPQPSGAAASAGSSSATSPGMVASPSISVAQPARKSTLSTTGVINTRALTAVNTMLPVTSYTMGTSNACSTSGVKESFTTLDSVAYLRVSLQNIKSGDSYRYDWYDPSGSRYQRKTFGKRSAASKVCHANKLLIKGTSVATKPGKWTVKFYHNNHLKITKSFTISRPVLKTPVFRR